jgi:antibiotic biosynthesis monooxygenase (ABM) superfamily enzyme
MSTKHKKPQVAEWTVSIVLALGVFALILVLMLAVEATKGLALIAIAIILLIASLIKKALTQSKK